MSEVRTEWRSTATHAVCEVGLYSEEDNKLQAKVVLTFASSLSEVTRSVFKERIEARLAATARSVLGIMLLLRTEKT